MGEYFKGNFGIFTEWVLTPGNFAQLAPNAPRAGFIFALFVIYRSCCLPLKKNIFYEGQSVSLKHFYSL